MDQIERLQFTVNIGLANSFRVFLRNIASNSAVRELLSLARSEEVGAAILRRVLFLTDLRSDFRYLNRYDIPLATYLWVLSRTQPDFAVAAASAVADLPRTWWADQTARHVLSQAQSQTGAPSDVALLGVIPDARSFNASNVVSGTSVFSPANTTIHLSTPVRANAQADGTATSLTTKAAPENKEIVLDSTASGTQEVAHSS